MLMKRLNIFLLSMAIAICTNAQFKGSVSVAPNEPEKTYQIAFNLISVCKSMDVTEDVEHDEVNVKSGSTLILKGNESVIQDTFEVELGGTFEIR